jgi:hypothetical protein
VQMASDPSHNATIFDQLPDSRLDSISANRTASRAAASYNRRRAGHACVICRSRKTKCDNQRPICGFCAATGGNCQYVDSDPSQLDRCSLAIIQRISELESSLVNHIDKTLKQRGPAPADASSGSDHLLHSPDGWPQSASEIVHREVAQGAEAFDFNTNPIEKANQNQYDRAKADENGPPHDMPPSSETLRQASEMFIESVLRWPIFSEAAPHLKESLEMPIAEVLGPSERSGTGSRGDKGRTGSTLPNLDADVINHLIGNFLENNHVKNPVLDVKSLRMDAREFAESGPLWDGRSCLIVSDVPLYLRH